MTRAETLIIGGGPSGLATAYGLQGNTIVLEKEPTVGGLCRSVHHGGGVFDIGGHSFHTPHSDVSELVDRLMGGRLYVQERDARIYTNGALIPYPFQKHFDKIPDARVVEACRMGLRTANRNGQNPKNLEDEILQKFGSGIAEYFLLPYNRKLWARDITQLSCEWTSERIATAIGDTQNFETTGDERKPLQSNTLVAYPQSGGFEEIFKSFVPHIPCVETNQEVCHIDPKEKTATTRNGERYHWDTLVTTIPLPILVQIVEGTPVEITELANMLCYMSLRVELLLTRRQLRTPIQRVYIADPEFPPHKIALNHNSSAYLRGKRCHAIMAEVSISKEKPVDVDQIVPRTVNALCDMGILGSPNDIVWQSHLDIEYAYPVYTHDRPFIVKAVKDWMAQRGIYTLGRFGDWEYINSDKCIKKALDLANGLRRSRRKSHS